MHFGVVLEGIWAYFWLNFAMKILSKNALEISYIFRSILRGIWIPLASNLAPKIAPKIDPGRPWSTESPLEHAQEPQDLQKSPKMEPKVSPRPSKSTLWMRPGFQNGAPELPTWNPKAPDFLKWTLTQGTPNEPKTNQTSSQTSATFETKLDPIWNQPGTKFWIH